MPATDLRLQPKMYTERELVLFVRTIPFEDAVALLEQYGRTKISEGRADHAVDVFNRVSVGMEGKPNA